LVGQIALTDDSEKSGNSLPHPLSTRILGNIKQEKVGWAIFN
jgi:hypothetical protein